MNNLARKPEGEPSEETALLSVIARAAADPQCDLDKMERLLNMQERIISKRAESDFNQAMSAAQAQMSRVATDSDNPQTRSRYASYGALDKALRPIYTANGFSISFDTGDAPREDFVRVLAIVSHRGGHSRTYHADMPADGKGAKGGDVMTKTHAFGAASSYGMRYLLKMIFNVAVGENDNDGNGPTALVDDNEQANIQALLEETSANQNAFFKWAAQYTKRPIGSIADIPKSLYPEAVRQLEAKRKKG